MIFDTVGPAARVGIVGVNANRRDLAAALSGHGVSVAPISGEWASVAESPELLAANFAGREKGPVLRGEEAVALERTRAQRTAWLVVAAALVVLALSAGVELWADRLPGAVLAIGNAPTALFRLLELIDDGVAPPAGVLGGPVGFVGSAQSKQELIDNPRGTSYLVVRGRRGGSAMAAAAVNAIASDRE